MWAIFALLDPDPLTRLNPDPQPCFKDTNPLMSSLLVIFVWGGGSNFVGSEFGQKQSVKLLQNMVYSTIQHPPPPPPRHTLSV